MTFWIIVFFALLFAGFFILPRLGWISANQAKELLKQDAALVDVRSQGEFRGGSAEGAVNLPVGEIERDIAAKGWSRDRPIIVFCASGARSALAKRQLTAAGYAKVFNLGTVTRARRAVTARS